MRLNTSEDASRYTQRFYPGAYDFTYATDATGVPVGWTFRVPSRDFGWVLRAGDVSTQTYAYRWWAEDVAHEWLNGRDLGTG